MARLMRAGWALTGWAGPRPLRASEWMEAGRGSSMRGNLWKRLANARRLRLTNLNRTDWQSRLGQNRLCFRNSGLAEMEDRGGQHGAGMAFGDTLHQIVQRTHAARGDHRHMDGVADGAGERDVIARFGAVAVHRGEQNLARAMCDQSFGMLDRVDA